MGDNSNTPSDDNSPEGDARKTVDHLLNGRLTPKTVKDIGHAVDRASSNNAVSNIFRKG